MDISTILSGMQEQPQSQTQLTEDQQRARLQDWYASVTEDRGVFEPGQLVGVKPAARINSPHRESCAVFVSYLDEPLRPLDLVRRTGFPEDMADATSNQMAEVFDCVVAFLHVRGDHEVVAKFLLDSAVLEPR